MRWQGGALVILGLVLAAAPGQAQIDLEIPLSREVAGSAEQLARLRGDIRSVRAELDSLSGQREVADRSVAQVTREIGLVKELVAGLDQREAILEQQRDTLQVRLEGQRGTYDLRKQALGARLRAVYMEGPQRDLELILTSESFSTLVARLKFNAMLARLDGNLVDRTRRQGLIIEAEQKQLQAALAGIWEAREEARREREQLETLEAERRGMLREVQAEEERVQQQLAALTRQERRLADLMTQLEVQRAQQEIAQPQVRQDGVPFGDRRGDLPWPVSGTVAREFGRSVHPRFGTVTMHNGLSVEALAGAPVYAVAPGTVQFADHLPGYGRCVILDHGSGFYTLYANLARIFPTRGTRVSGGQIVAELGVSAESERPELYFEIREGREARDPAPGCGRRAESPLPRVRGTTCTADQRLGRRYIADRLVRLVEDGRLGQPLLFTGPAGCGKDVTALAIARRLNCRTPDHCGPEQPCESCQKANTFQHPDIRWFGPAPAAYEDQKQTARVREILDAKRQNPFFTPVFAATSQVLIGNPEHPGPLTVRGLMQFTRRQSFQGRWKVAVVADAHRMNAAAANALLKTLEEPPPATLIILHTSRPSSLLPTILSRCQKVPFEPYAEADLEAILALLSPDADPASLTRAARLAGGDARRAMALLEPEMEGLLAWARNVFTHLNAGARLPAHAAAEVLNLGCMPGTKKDGSPDPRASKVDDSPGRRRRALVFCEMLALLCGEALSCLERGDAWRPRLVDDAELVRTLACRRRTAGLLADLERIEQAKHDIDGNLNLGLVMAALCEDLSSHVRRDQIPTSA